MSGKNSETEIRPVAPNERQRHAELMAQSFGSGRIPEPPADDEWPRAGRSVYGLYEKGALQAAYTLHDFRAHWGGEGVLPLGGIAGVGSFVEARGRGHVAALLQHALATMRERGQVVSALYPFAWAFYRRFGWDWVGERRRVTLPLAEVRSSPEGRNVSELRAEEARGTLEPIYAAFARGYRGVHDAETHQWDDLLRHQDGRRTYVYVHQAPGSAPDGYLVWRYPGGGGTGQVRALVANTPAAYRGLLSLLHYFATQCPKARLDLPADDPLWAHVMYWDLETRLGPVFMGRVVDAPAALQSLKSGAPDGQATLALRDEHAPWNGGTWRITGENGAISCTPASGEPDLACDIAAFSQAFWGAPSLPWLHRAGRIEVNSERALDWLTRVLSGPPVWTFDEF